MLQRAATNTALQVLGQTLGWENSLTRYWLTLIVLAATMTNAASTVQLAAQQETVTLSGTVSDSVTALPLTGVAVLCDGSAIPETTDSAGSFRLRNLRQGSHVVVLLKNGYAPRSFDFVLSVQDAGEIDVENLLLSPGRPPAATISGTVVDSLTGLPVRSAQVAVNGEYVAVTDGYGSFWIPSIDLLWGSNIIEIRGIGYASKQAELWTARDSVEVNAEISLTPIAILMSEVVVEGERTVHHFGRSREFVRRSRTGLGRYITRLDIEKRQPLYISDLVSSVPGVLVSPTARGNVVRMSRSGCAPVVFLDGVRLRGITVSLSGAQSFGLGIDDLVDPDNVEGIEVYSGPATTPFEFGSNTDCGVIAIWTRR